MWTEVLAVWPKLTADWLVSLSSVTGSWPLFTGRRLDLRTVEEKNATTEDKETELSFLFFFCNFVLEDVPLVVFMYPVFTRIPDESYRRPLRSLLLYLCYVFPSLINSLVFLWPSWSISGWCGTRLSTGARIETLKKECALRQIARRRLGRE